MADYTTSFSLRVKTTFSDIFYIQTMLFTTIGSRLDTARWGSGNGDPGWYVLDVNGEKRHSMAIPQFSQAVPGELIVTVMITSPTKLTNTWVYTDRVTDPSTVQHYSKGEAKHLSTLWLLEMEGIMQNSIRSLQEEKNEAALLPMFQALGDGSLSVDYERIPPLSQDLQDLFNNNLNLTWSLTINNAAIYGVSLEPELNPWNRKFLALHEVSMHHADINEPDPLYFPVFLVNLGAVNFNYTVDPQSVVIPAETPAFTIRNEEGNGYQFTFRNEHTLTVDPFVFFGVPAILGIDGKMYWIDGVTNLTTKDQDTLYAKAIDTIYNIHNLSPL